MISRFMFYNFPSVCHLQKIWCVLFPCSNSTELNWRKETKKLVFASLFAVVFVFAHAQWKFSFKLSLIFFENEFCLKKSSENLHWKLLQLKLDNNEQNIKIPRVKAELIFVIVSTTMGKIFFLFASCVIIVLCAAMPTVEKMRAKNKREESRKNCYTLL